MKKRQKNKPRPSVIGRRTGVDVVQGKKIRRQDDGTDVFDDYWTDSDSVDSNETQPMHSLDRTVSHKTSENASILNRNSVSYRNSPRLSMKKSLNERSGEYKDHNGYFSPDRLKRLEVSRNKGHFFEEIGRRTGVDVIRGKNIRTQEDGTDVYDDYWTEESNRDSQSARSSVKTRNEETPGKGSSINRKLSNFIEALELSQKETQNQGNENCEDHDDYTIRPVFTSPKQSKKSEVSRKKSNFFEDGENSAIARSKMTQTSHLLDETESMSSVNGIHMHEKSGENNGANLSDSKINSSVGKSPKMSYSSQTPSRKECLPSSREDARVTRLSVSENKANEIRNSRVMTPTSRPLEGIEGSPSRNRTYTPKTSYSKESIQKHKIDSSDSDGSSPSNVSKSSDEPHRRENLSSLRAVRVSLSSKMESERKAEHKRKSRVMTRTSHPLDESDSPVENRTYTPKRSYPKETAKSRSDSSGSERNFTTERLRVLSETSHVSNRREDLPSSSGHTIAARVSLSSKMESGKKAKDKRNSRVMTQIYPLNETGASPLKNMADSCDSVRKLSVEKCSGVLSKTLSSPNSKNEVNKRNSLSRLSHYTARSSELLNQKVNISSRNDSNANKSVPGQKKKDKRKSSVGKSPIVVERKMMEAPDDLEDSLSMTSGVQNRWEEGSEKNFTGEKSRHHTAKSSEVLNLKQNKSQSNNIVNRSEILVSHQKENYQDEDNQNSSAEKSSSASESDTMQNPDLLENGKICSIGDSRRKTTSHNHVQENESPSKRLRRSSRYRLPPLAIWRNERLKFVKASASNEYECLGVTESRPEDDYPLRVIKNRYKPVKKRKMSTWNKRSNIPKHIIKTPIINEKTEKTVELYLHRPFNSYEWILPPYEDNPGYMISRTFKSRYMTFGFLDIAGRSIKDKQHSPQDNLHFVVFKGVVEVVINTTSFTFGKGDSFIVPVGTFYSIKNNMSSNALLNFTSFRIPFFTYQEKD